MVNVHDNWGDGLMISVRTMIVGGIWTMFAWVFMLPAGIVAAQNSEQPFNPAESIARYGFPSEFTTVMDRLSDGRLNPNLVVDWYGHTVMHLVAPASLELLRMTVAKGGDCGVANNIGLTPLHYAAMSWEFGPGPESMRILVDGGESVTTTVRVGDRVWIERSDGKAEFVHASKLAESVGPAVGERFSDCSVCPEMVVVPAGSFLMGSPSSERLRDDDEGPVHRVTIPQPFAVGRYEVTFDQWDACVSDGGCFHVPDDVRWGRGSRPVINVSWYDAGEYMDWLSHKTGKRYRLLSEAEWEYAARAGTTGPFHFGETISTDQANYDSYDSNSERTVPVGRFPGNAFGLHDVHGNVWEWVEDCWHGSYHGAPSDGSAWTSGGSCGARMLRGGSWSNLPFNLRSASRRWKAAGNRGIFNLGFRVARTLAP